MFYICPNYLFLPHEAISVFDMFKVGIGPSSSHTLGPWRAAQRFTDSLQQKKRLQEVVSLEIILYGSLAKTGKGHGTDIAVQLGLSGEDPVTFDVDAIESKMNDILAMKKLVLHGLHEIDFDPREDIEFLMSETLPYHPNALTFGVTFQDGGQFAETYYSIGGGFVKKEGEKVGGFTGTQLPFPVNTSENLLHWCRKTGMAIMKWCWKMKMPGEVKHKLK